MFNKRHCFDSILWVSAMIILSSALVLGCGSSSSKVVCTNGQTQCSGNEVQACQNSIWVNAIDCSTSREACQNGACALMCQSGRINCNDECVNLLTDNRYCSANGTCGTGCAAGYVCNGFGVCAPPCQFGLTYCNDECVNLLTDNRYCSADGNCGTDCAVGYVCNGFGVCAPSCQFGLTNCYGGCVNLLIDNRYCSADGTCWGGCWGSYVCNGSGVCALSCQFGLTNCNGECVNLLTDNRFCSANGSCGTGCASGYICNGSGVCAPSCQFGLTNCNGECVNLLTDNRYCSADGNCGTSCAVGYFCNGSGTCVSINCDWSQVSAGYSHTCAVKKDGRIFCWGYNAYGELGNNSNWDIQLQEPVQENTAATDWSQVSAALNHTCAVKEDGRIFCWGDNPYGELGNNSTSQSLLPVQENTAATDWSQVSAGYSHTCAVKKDGRIFCWGYNAYGELGNNSTSQSLVPVQENTAATDWRQVSTGYYHTCAVKKDSRIFCWGDNYYGELGNNVTYDILTPPDSPVPVQEYTAETDWSQVSAGYFHTCAVKKDGRIFCWGYNAFGELGNNSTSQSLVPVQENTAANDWSQISTGVGHTCAVKKDGRIFCWGYNANGELGNNSTSQSLVPVQENTAATDWSQVSAGYYHTCAVKTDGQLFCWGFCPNGGGPCLSPVWQVD